MEKCKICGKEFKNVHGLILHLYGAHKIKKAEYDERYGNNPSQVDLQEDTREQIAEIPVNNKIENQDEKMKEEMEEKNNEKRNSVTMKISNVEWLDKKIRSEWIAVFEENGIMQTTEPVAMGIITTETEQVPGLLIMATNGKLIPPWIFESFKGIYTHKELRAIEKSKRKEEKLQRNIAKEKERANILKKLWQSQKAQKQNRLSEEDILNKIKASIDETEAIRQNEREDRIGFSNPNMFQLVRQGSNILNPKRKQ